MAEFHYPLSVNVRKVGHIARSLIHDDARIRIGAVFENSFYIETPGPWVCMTGPSPAMGPLSLHCNPGLPVDWRRCGVHAGMTVFIGQQCIYLPPIFRFPLAGAYTWTPPAVPQWTLRSLRRGIRYVARWMQESRRADEGLSSMFLADSQRLPMSATANQARDAVEQLQGWLSSLQTDHDGVSAFPSSSIDCLTGLGPGLTPSGDDFLGGAMVALHLVGRPAAAQRMFESIVSQPALAGNPISRSHLSAAAQGTCNAWIHTALNAVLAGDVESLACRLNTIGGIGHTSGWDTLTGALIVLAARAAHSQAA